MNQKLIQKINKMICCDFTIEFRIDSGIRADKIEPETVYIDEYCFKDNTILKDYPKAMKIKELLLNNGYVLENEEIISFNNNDILNLRFKSKGIISKREY